MCDFFLPWKPWLMIFCICYLCHIELSFLDQIKLSKLIGLSWIGELSFPSDSWPQHQDGKFWPVFCKQLLFPRSLRQLKFQAHHRGKPFVQHKNRVLCFQGPLFSVLKWKQSFYKNWNFQFWRIRYQWIKIGIGSRLQKKKCGTVG